MILLYFSLYMALGRQTSLMQFHVSADHSEKRTRLFIIVQSYFYLIRIVERASGKQF